MSNLIFFIWIYCPKHKNKTKLVFDFAMAQAVINCNVGFVGGDLSRLNGDSILKIIFKKHLENIDAEIYISMLEK